MARLSGKTSAGFKGITDLLVQLVAVGEDHKGGTARELTANLLRKKHHRIALAAALGVPEYAELTVFEFSRLIGFHRFVDTEVLMVASTDFDALSARMVKENEILEKVHEILFFADAEKHGFQVNKRFRVKSLLQDLSGKIQQQDKWYYIQKMVNVM